MCSLCYHISVLLPLNLIITVFETDIVITTRKVGFAVMELRQMEDKSPRNTVRRVHKRESVCV